MTDGAGAARSRVRRWLGPGTGIAVLAVAIALGVRFGAPAAVLWSAFVALVGAVLLFWEGLRLALDPAVEERDDDGVSVGGVSGDLEDRKRAALRALRDIDFERSIRRLSEEDYAELRERYRAEARDALRAIDEATQATLGAHLTKAERLVARALGELSTPRDAAIVDAATASASGSASASGKKRKRAGGAKRGRAPGSTVDVPTAADRAAAPAEGDDADSSGRDEPSDAGGDADAQRTCPNAACGTDNDGDAVFCKKCGTRMEAGA